MWAINNVFQWCGFSLIIALFKSSGYFRTNFVPDRTRKQSKFPKVSVRVVSRIWSKGQIWCCLITEKTKAVVRSMLSLLQLIFIGHFGSNCSAFYLDLYRAAGMGLRSTTSLSTYISIEGCGLCTVLSVPSTVNRALNPTLLVMTEKS